MNHRWITFDHLLSRVVATGSIRMGYVVCTILFLSQKDQLCPGHGDMYAMGQFERTQEWQTRLQIVQFAIMAVCAVQLLLGFIGKWKLLYLVNGARGWQHTVKFYRILFNQV